MAKGKAEALQVAPGRRTKSGLVKYMFSLKPEHASALREEAFKRATAAGRSQLDTGAILREVLDSWMAKRR